MDPNPDSRRRKFELTIQKKEWHLVNLPERNDRNEKNRH